MQSVCAERVEGWGAVRAEHPGDRAEVVLVEVHDRGLEDDGGHFNHAVRKIRPGTVCWTTGAAEGGDSR